LGYGDDGYVAFLRGINVGGHHKLPMFELKTDFEELGLEDILTVLNTGNVIFKHRGDSSADLEDRLETQLSEKHGFPIPVMVRKLEDLRRLVARDPFKAVAMNDHIRLYITFTKEQCRPEIDVPFSTEDGAFHLLNYSERIIESYLDLGKTQTTKGMELLDKLFKTDITTRNYNTIVAILEKAPRDD
jgi:uncharacterized protein (DUF1697 family)